MPGVESNLVLLPRFTTLVGEGVEFATLPVDVSRYGTAQLLLWRGELQLTGGTPVFQAYFEESLDAEDWHPRSSVATPIDPGEDQTYLVNYTFRLKWFRVRIVLGGDGAMTTCWAEGVLR